ncbi:MAG TPA: CoB--CoM heterodisulfide reductase iron-sulfur subunit A family protein [Syntrophorhabdaceae bacterium]|nr:CoB--CoM heterodisulfide reductase iron-sulfur subunit A family protein [Syntrophorhabdaceae bacterium]HPU29985.1 CoB--CoM heterodisulfide reductase iron-sulfur subunit A family protein [Syntrophorhabdaceae bacterium]
MKAGIFICHCGHNIKHTVDVRRLSEYFKKIPGVEVAIDYAFVCSEPGQDIIKESIENKHLDRVVIASCTPSLHGDLFKDLLKKSGINPFYLRRVSIREHCSWVGDDIEANTEKAKRLILSGLYSASHYIPLEEKMVEVNKSALVIGGGVSGLNAALFLAKMGIKVYLVEREEELGGHVRLLNSVWPSKRSGREIVAEMVDELNRLANVDIYTNTTITNFEGFFGNYQVTLKKGEDEKKIIVGGVVVATGFVPFDPSIKPELHYNKDKRIVTTLDLEKGLETLEISKKPRVAILHCIGSRDETIGKSYCSRICCINAIKTAEALKEKYPESYIESFYMDVRAHPKGGEEYFESVQEKGVLFTRGNVAEIIPTDKSIIIRGEDTLLGEVYEKEFDLVVLSIGMSSPVENKALGQLLKISLDKDGFFLEAHIKLRPFDTAVKGIFIAGSCSGPKDAEESINHGKASALKLFGMLNLGYTFVDPFISYVDPKRCSGCRQCEEACIAKAIKFDEKLRIVKVEEAACMGCGLCNATCPSSAISLKGYFDSYISDEISGLLEIA